MQSVMIEFPPTLLERFSARGRALLSRAQPFAVERDPSAVAAKLTACGRPAWESVLDFQRDIGGLRWPSNELAIQFREIEPDEDDLLHLEETMVPIGSVAGDGDATAYMNEAGEVFSNFGRRSSSVTSYIEQAAMSQAIPALGGAPRSEGESEAQPRFSVYLRPALGDALAEALSMSTTRVPEASDAYEQWWADSRILLRHRSYDALSARQDVAITSSLAAAVHVLSRARSVLPALFVHVGATPVTYLRLSPEDAAKIPDEHSWSGTRYAFGNEADFGDGSVWIVGDGEGLRVQEYIKYNGVLHDWNTIDAAGATYHILPRLV
jgi:hypothetical protein